MSDQVQRAKVVIAGILSLVVMVGVARFAYTPMIPIMFEQSSLSIAQSGALAAINYLGYLLGAIITSRIKSIEFKDKLYRASLIMGVVTTAMMGLADNVWVWSISRFFAGLSATGGMLLASALVMHYLVKHDFKPEIGLHFSGMGFGIVVCALIVEYTHDIARWDQQWIYLTVVSGVLSIWAWRWLPKATTSHTTRSGSVLQDKPPSNKFLRIFQLAYFFSGIGYVVSATYISATIQTLPGMQSDGVFAFVLVGVGAIPAAFICDLVARKMGLFNALSFTLFIKLIGISLTIVSNYSFFPMLGAILFGYGFVGVVNLVLTIAGRYYPSMPAKMMGVMTISYGVSQIFAPAMTGYLAQISGSYIFATLLAAVSVGVSMVIMMYLSSKPEAKFNH